MFGLDPTLTFLLIVCLIAACAFEFINGFHDTANAVATVIYTNSLKPWVAVIWSAVWNSVGVFAGGITVAMGISYLIPVEILADQNIYHSVALIMALLITAIVWNLGTWYFGIPCSSSHTLVGSILGVGLAYSFIAEKSGNYVNWSKASDIGLSLLVSPIVGFSLTILIMYLLRVSVKNKSIFKAPKTNDPPPFLIRMVLLLTCTGVSYSHGSNDGQKGIGLVMLILIAIAPSYFALNPNVNLPKVKQEITMVDSILHKTIAAQITKEDSLEVAKALTISGKLNKLICSNQLDSLSVNEKFEVRQGAIKLGKEVEKLKKSKTIALSDQDKTSLKASVTSVKTITEYSPSWVIIMISISLGLGTMIGWKRIVKTIGEKIGKQHLNYAQGASSELVAAATIGMATAFGLPVSTTQVLSSGIAGSMVATKGMKNLQSGTIKNIAIAWILTLPVTIILSGLLFLL
ncbi:MAG: inorganic phosphate transporter, partial [Bacteroidia bacterium]|nr:inorganic phosphate transporter [Bacteroidia bacterium]